MSDTLFIQFYGRTGSGWYDLCNGFSDTHDLCLSKGEFLWMPHEQEPDNWYSQEMYDPYSLPIRKGTVYVSASYFNHLYQAYTWALAHPDVSFVVGGPVAAERCGTTRDWTSGAWNSVHFKVEEALPFNLKLTGISVERLFNVPDFSGRWRLSLPPDIDDQSRIYFSYTLENMCYWKKCPFCSIAQHDMDHYRKRRNLALEFTDIDFPGHKIVRLNTGSITPAHILDILPRLPVDDDIEYRFFMRAARAETQALEKAVEQMRRNGEERLPECTLGFGIEFPSDRMWRYLNKGTRMDEVLETLEFCTRTGFKVNANVILGWNNLIDQDLRDLEGFMDRLTSESVTTLQLRWLFAHPYTEIYETYSGVDNSIRMGPFNCGFNVALDEAQKAVNREAARIIKTACDRSGIKLEGYKNLKKGFL